MLLMRPSQPLSPFRRRGRLAAGAVAAALILAACGGGSDSVRKRRRRRRTTSRGRHRRRSDAGAVDESSAETETAPAAAGTGLVDLVGPDVIPAAEIDTNVLPSVVVDDLNNDRKVNFRNLVPQDKPVLLWMYAPH